MSLEGRRTPTQLLAALRCGYNETAAGCWQWHGSMNTYGYGRMKVGGHVVGAHRVAYELLVGPIPDGLELDHLCRKRACVNPAHLEPVTRTENILRGSGAAAVNARKTHCKRGHPLAGDNLRIVNGQRRCQTCTLASNRLYDRRRGPERLAAARRTREALTTGQVEAARNGWQPDPTCETQP